VGVSARAITAHAPYDLIFANILLGPLMRLAAPVSRLAAPGARIVLSGLLPAHANAALAAYRARGLTLERRIPLDGWMTLVLRRG
jgi:ribosomal protein L11 methyltransferase